MLCVCKMWNSITAVVLPMGWYCEWGHFFWLITGSVIHVYIYIYWLVVFNHLEKYESQWEWLSHILWKNKIHVPNHQPVNDLGVPRSMTLETPDQQYQRNPSKIIMWWTIACRWFTDKKMVFHICITSPQGNISNCFWDGILQMDRPKHSKYPQTLVKKYV